MTHEMETIKPKSAIDNKSNKLTKTFQKVISFRAATKIALNNGMCILTSQARVKQHLLTDRLKTHKGNGKHEDIKARNRAVMEALIAKLFAGVSTIKAAYAELQMAQHPYNNEAIQKADQAVVDELRAISELKLSFLQKELKLSPQVTLMLAEIQEQQSLMKTYEIIIKKLEAQVHVKEAEHSSLKKHIDECIPYNKSLEKKLNSSGSLSMLENLQLSVLSPSHFVQFLHRTLRSIRSFVKLMICEMESAHWDLEAAVRFIHPDAVFATPNHQYLAFESFVCITMFEGFNYPNFTVPNQPLKKPHHHSQQLYFEKFKKLKSLNLKHYLAQGPNSSLARFLKSKYLQVIHAKMECSLFGNLNQRKLLNNGGVPDSEFFMAFAEMAKRVWALHCLAFSFEEEVTIFQVKKNTRFSEVYMECAAEQKLLSTSGEATDFNSGELRVGFTVVPGFKIGKTVIQSQVYLSPVGSPASC